MRNILFLSKYSDLEPLLTNYFFFFCLRLEIQFPLIAEMTVFPTGGMFWWITVTPPPLGILMMRYAMTFSLGNLVFSEIMCALTRWVLITCSTDYYTMHKGLLEEMICACECVRTFVWVWLKIITLSSDLMFEEALFLVVGV